MVFLNPVRRGQLKQKTDSGWALDLNAREAHARLFATRMTWGSTAFPSAASRWIAPSSLLLRDTIQALRLAQQALRIFSSARQHSPIFRAHQPGQLIQCAQGNQLAWSIIRYAGSSGFFHIMGGIEGPSFPVVQPLDGVKDAAPALRVNPK